jgi:hypothetical protein
VALVGEAHIVVRAITSKVAGDIKNGFSGIGSIGDKAGADVGKSFSKGFAKNNKSIFDSAFITKAIAANKQLVSLTRTGRTVGTALAGLVSSVGSLAGGLVSLGAAALSAGPSLVALGGIFAAIGIGAITAKLALGGVGAAVGKLNKQKTQAAKDDTAAKRREQDALKALALIVEKNGEASKQYDEDLEESKKKVTEAQLEYNEAVKKGNEELQQLGFDAEDAALAEKKAALELEKARETLQRTQDLPPNSRARKEAELAYAQAELALRKAKDANSDLAAEQDRLAKTGVAGTEVVISAQEKLTDAKAAQAKLEKDRIKEVRDGVRAELDGELDLKRAREDLAKVQAPDDAAGSDPLEGLTESQATFAKFLSTLKPQVEEIKEAAAGAFLPKLQEGIEIVAEKGFPVIKEGVATVGDALGNASITIAEAITEAGNLKDLATLFENAAASIETLGAIVGNLWGVFLSTLKAVNPLVEKFLGWLEKVTAEWEATLDTEEGQKKLTDFFNEAGRVAGEIGTIIGNIAKGLGNIIKANTGPGTGGQIMLDYFRDITQAFKDFSGSDSGQKQLKEYFADVAENSKAILSGVGAFVKEILKAGADPNVKVFWDTLKTGAPIFGEILKSSNEALPSLATLIVKILEIVKIFTDSGAIIVFFDTLSKAADVVIKVFENPVVNAIVENVGKVLAFFSAVGLIFSALRFGVLGVTGGIAKIGLGIKKGIGFVKDPFGGLRSGSAKTRTELQKQMVIDKQKQAAMGAVGTAGQRAATGIRAAGTASAGAVTPMANASRSAGILAGAKRGLGAAATAAGTGLRAAGRGLAAFGGPIGILLLVLPLIIQNWDKIVAFFKELPSKLKEIFTKVWDAAVEALPKIWEKIKEVVGNVIGWLKENWPLILAILTGPFGLAILAIVKNWDTILDFIKGLPGKLAELGAKIWDWIVDTFKKAVDLYIAYWTTIFDFIKDVGKTLLEKGKAIWDWIVDTFKLAVDLYIGAWTAIFDFIAGVGATLLEKGKKIWDWIVDVFITAKDNFIANWTAIFTYIGELAGKLKEKGAKIWDWITDKLVDAFTAIKTKFTEIITWITGLPARVATAAKGIWNGFRDGFKDALNWIIGKWNAFKIEARFPPDFIVPFLRNKGFTLDTPYIPPLLAMGGIVPATPGGMLARIGEAGRPERVEPLDPDGLSKRDKAMIQMLAGGSGGGPVINVYPSQGMNENDLAEIISRKIAFTMRKGAA